MGAKLKRTSQAIVAFAVLFLSALLFQNCSGYQVYDLAQTEELSSTCTDCNQSVEGLSLKTTNTSIKVIEADLNPRIIDIAGYCDDADFSQSDLQYQFFDGGNPVNPSWVSTGVKCDDLGRFHIRPSVPTVSSRRDLVLRIRLAIPLGAGQFLGNPGAAEKQVVIVVSP